MNCIKSLAHVCSSLAVVLSLAPAVAQETQPNLQQQIDGALGTLKRLNDAAPELSPNRSSQTKPPAGVSEEAIDELAKSSLDFVLKYSPNRVIYGPDNRKNYDDTSVTVNERLAADATAVFISVNNLTSNNDNTFKADKGKLRFCSPAETPRSLPLERFYNEPTPGFCTGFKVGPDLVATAGHCVKSAADCKNLRVVFGFRKTRDVSAPEARIPSSSIYSCRAVLAGELGGADESDWRLIRVDRQISAPQVSLRTSSMPKIALGTEITLVGHPAGLPVKIATGATVQKQKEAYFQADTDSYGGNSGSPVFNSERLRKGELFVEGILVRGERDYLTTSPCAISKRCPHFVNCKGEDVTYATRLESALRAATRQVSR